MPLDNISRSGGAKRKPSDASQETSKKPKLPVTLISGKETMYSGVGKLEASAPGHAVEGKGVSIWRSLFSRNAKQATNNPSPAVAASSSATPKNSFASIFERVDEKPGESNESSPMDEETYVDMETVGVFGAGQDSDEVGAVNPWVVDQGERAINEGNLEALEKAIARGFNGDTLVPDPKHPEKDKIPALFAFVMNPRTDKLSAQEKGQMFAALFKSGASCRTFTCRQNGVKLRLEHEASLRSDSTILNIVRRVNQKEAVIDKTDEDSTLKERTDSTRIYNETLYRMRENARQEEADKNSGVAPEDPKKSGKPKKDVKFSDTIKADDGSIDITKTEDGGNRPRRIRR